MPLERIVEFRIAAPVDVLPDLILFIGKAGVAMFEERPQRLARPRDPVILHGIKKLDEILSFILQYYQPKIISLPKQSLSSLLENILKDLSPLLEDVVKLSAELQELRQRYQLAVALRQLKGLKIPEMEALEALIVVPGKRSAEVLNLCRDIGAVAITVGDAIIVSIPKNKVILLTTSLSKLDVAVLRPRELDSLEEPDVVASKINNIQNRIKENIYKYAKIIDLAYTLRYTFSLVIDTFNKSALSEGEETGHLFASLGAEIERLKSEVRELSAIRDVLANLKTSGVNNARLPDGFALYAVLEEPSSASEVKIGNITAYIARDGLRGVKVPAQYLEDVGSSLKVVEETLNSIRRSLNNREKELEGLERIYKEYSVYGDKNWTLHKDIGSIIFYVREIDVAKIDDVLTDFVKTMSVKLDVIRNIRYKYFHDVPAERRPTLEKFPSPIKQIANKIVYMYGIPGATEISPSILVAALFPIFFGWMFGDLGHGLLLFLFGLWLYTSLFGGKYKDWGVIWIVAGASSMFFGGVVYGELFGFPLSYLGLHWDGLVHMFQPVVGPQMGTAVEGEGIFANLFLALLFGYLIMAGSFLLKIANFVARGEGDMALGIGVPILLIYISAGMIVFGLLKSVLPMPAPLASAVSLPWIYVLVAAIVLLIIGAMALMVKYKNYEESPPIGLEMAVGLIEGVFGGLANVPSFARLMILILMHGIFTKLSMGWALAVAASGNLAGAVAIAVVFNILIAVGEGFMSLVQSLRLTFYETLSKFYEGRGRLFVPLVLP